MSSMLTVEEYAAVLFVTELVTFSVNTTKDRGYEAKTSHDRSWHTFFEANKIDRANLNLAEATRTQAKVGAFKRKHEGTPIGESLQKLHLICIGKYKIGEAIVASKYLTDGVAPPNFHCTRKLRAAQQKLPLDVSLIIKPIMNSKKSDADTKIADKKMVVIADWVRMTELEEDVHSSKSKVGMPKAKADGDDGKSKTKADGDDNPHLKEE